MTTARGHRRWTLTGAAILVAVLAACVALGLASGDGRPGRTLAIGFAASVSLVGSLGGWLAGRASPADPARGVALGLAAVGLRIFPALAGLAWLRSAGARLREAGAAEWLLVFYLALLATDILLHIIGSRTGGTAEH
jgi:hypothetical protein